MVLNYESAMNVVLVCTISIKSVVSYFRCSGFCNSPLAITPARRGARCVGADVLLKLLFGELGLGTGLFYKECSKPGTPLEAARSAVEPWW